MDTPPPIPISVIVPPKKNVIIGIIFFILLALSSVTATIYLLKPQLSKLLSSLETAQAVAHWKTFSDGDKGIEFKYPDTWTVATYPGGTAAVFLENHSFEFGSAATPTTTSIIISFEQGTSLTTLVPGQQELFDAHSFKKIEDFTVGDKQGTQLSGMLTSDDPEIPSTYSKRTFIPLSDTVMTITLRGKESEPVYDNIVSTFKFLDNSQFDTRSRTYTNSTFGYTMRYPSGYSIPGAPPNHPIVIVRNYDQEEAIEMDGFENNQHLSLDELAQNPPPQLESLLKRDGVKKVTINGRDALEVMSSTQTFYVLTDGQSIIKITIDLVYTDELQSIVDSFTFKK